MDGRQRKKMKISLEMVSSKCNLPRVDRWKGSSPISSERFSEYFSPSDPSLFDRLSLQLYVLIAAQNSSGSGGLRDKPGKRPDAYHTCYNLSGMSLAQHIVRPSRSIAQDFRSEFDKSRKLNQVSKLNESDSESEVDSSTSLEEWRKECYATTLGYMPLSKHTIIPGFTEGTLGVDRKSSQGEREKVGRANSVLPTHPVLNVTFARAKFMADWAYGVA